MQSDNFDQFSITRLWLLVRRDLMMLSFRHYFIIFTMMLSFILLVAFILWIKSDRLETEIFPFLAIPSIVLSIIPFYLTHDSPDFQHIQGYKTYPHPFPIEILPPRIKEKIVAEFIHLALLFPLTQAILLLLPTIIFHADFFIWVIIVETIVICCFPLAAFISFINTAIKNILILRHKLILGLALLMGLGGNFSWIFLFPKEDIPPLLHYIAAAEMVITAILLWATYRIQIKNAKR